MNIQRAIKELKHAFALEPESSSNGELPRPLTQLAEEIVERRLEVPAIILLETLRPLNFVASQTMIAAWPLAKLLGKERDFEEVAKALESRNSTEQLIAHIERLCK